MAHPLKMIYVPNPFVKDQFHDKGRPWAETRPFLGKRTNEAAML